MATPTLGADLSILDLFLIADPFVKLIMILLGVLSVMTWGIWFAKSQQLSRLQRKAKNFEDAFLSGEDLIKLYKDVKPNQADHPMARAFVVGLREWEQAEDNGETKEQGLRPSIIVRVRRRMDAMMTRDMESVESWLPFLATVGSSAPFIGLLGTVWGIMNSFTSIAATKNTSLAVVAPGIAEALFATALGLFAAIPATIAYNRLITRIGRYGGKLETFALEFLSLLESQNTSGKKK